MTFLLSANIFVGNLHPLTHGTIVKERYKVHSVASGTDETYVADVVEGDEFGKVDGLMHVVNRHEFDTAELAVDTSDEFIDGGTKVLVFFHVSSGRDCYLNQYHLAISQSRRRRGEGLFRAIQGVE